MTSTQYGGQMDTDKIKSRAQHLIDEDIIEPTQKYLEKAKNFSEKAMDKGADIVKQNPGYSMLGAAAIGFLAGAYFVRRR